MIRLLRTNSDNKDFADLVRRLDADLALRNGSQNDFYSQYNKIDMIRHVVIAYDDDTPVSCGAIKAFNDNSMEVKRMYTSSESRGKGIALKVLAELESWAGELSYNSCVLETGTMNPEALALYRKCGYVPIPNYDQYAGIETSICMSKAIR